MHLARERATKEQDEKVKDENEQVGKMACEAAIDSWHRTAAEGGGSGYGGRSRARVGEVIQTDMLRLAAEEQQHGRMMRASTMTDSQHDSEKHLKTAGGIKDSQQDSSITLLARINVNSRKSQIQL
jgi:hypothetical protein